LLFIADIGLSSSTVVLLQLTRYIAIGIFWVYSLSLVLPGENVFVDALFVRVTTFYSITLAMNVICTCLSFQSTPGIRLNSHFRLDCHEDFDDPESGCTFLEG
jgi:hypothetical protein